MLGSKEKIKTKELLIYIAHRLGDKPNYGATLLNKALYFIDNVSYLKTGSPISEFSYIKQEWGPTPDPSFFLSLRTELEDLGEISMTQTEYFGRIQKKVKANREPNIDIFTKGEIVIIDTVLANVCDWTGSEASDFSHSFPAWQIAKNSEPLPLFTFLLSVKQPTQNDIEWAKAEMK